MAEKKDTDKKGRENKGIQTPPPSKGKFEDNIFRTESENSKQPSESSEQYSESSEQSSESSKQPFISPHEFGQSEDLETLNNESNIPSEEIVDSKKEKKQIKEAFDPYKRSK